MSIDFKARPYGVCSFYIGDTKPSKSGTEHFSMDKDCRELTHTMGNNQTYLVRYL